MTPSSVDLAILRFLAGRTHASLAEVGGGCRMSANEVRPRIATLESHRLVASRQDASAKPPARVVYVTAEGRRTAGAIAAPRRLPATLP